MGKEKEPGPKVINQIRKSRRGEWAQVGNAWGAQLAGARCKALSKAAGTWCGCTLSCWSNAPSQDGRSVECPEVIFTGPARCSNSGWNLLQDTWRPPLLVMTRPPRGGRYLLHSYLVSQNRERQEARKGACTGYSCWALPRDADTETSGKENSRHASRLRLPLCKELDLLPAHVEFLVALCLVSPCPAIF